MLSLSFLIGNLCYLSFFFFLFGLARNLSILLIILNQPKRDMSGSYLISLKWHLPGNKPVVTGSQSACYDCTLKHGQPSITRHLRKLPTYKWQTERKDDFRVPEVIWETEGSLKKILIIFRDSEIGILNDLYRIQKARTGCYQKRIRERKRFLVSKIEK